MASTAAGSVTSALRVRDSRPLPGNKHSLLTTGRHVRAGTPEKGKGGGSRLPRGSMRTRRASHVDPPVVVAAAAAVGCWPSRPWPDVARRADGRCGATSGCKHRGRKRDQRPHPVPARARASRRAARRCPCTTGYRPIACAYAKRVSAEHKQAAIGPPANEELRPARLPRVLAHGSGAPPLPCRPTDTTLPPCSLAPQRIPCPDGDACMNAHNLYE